MGDHIYIGTYTEEIHFASGKTVYGKGGGIYHMRLDARREKLLPAGPVCRCSNPSYLALSRDGGYLYASNERKESGGVFGGTVSAYKVDRENGGLTFLNRRYTKGADPCYVTVHPSSVYVCNYGSGSVAAYPISEDGSLGEMEQLIQYVGKSRHKSRQAGPHAHSMILFEDGSRGLICDLGRDKIEAYRIDRSGRLEHRDGVSIVCPPGSGPRHLEFSPDGAYLYVVNELDSTVSAYRYEREPRGFTAIQRISTLVHDIRDVNTCADIHVSPNGGFLYVSNRGDGTIVIYRIHRDDGCLEMTGFTDSGGEVPRSFAITPDGTHLIVANQNSDNVVLFRIQEDGSLSQRDEVCVGNPVCVKICPGTGICDTF